MPTIRHFRHSRILDSSLLAKIASIDPRDSIYAIAPLARDKSGRMQMRSELTSAGVPAEVIARLGYATAAADAWEALDAAPAAAKPKAKAKAQAVAEPLRSHAEPMGVDVVAETVEERPAAPKRRKRKRSDD